VEFQVRVRYAAVEECRRRCGRRQILPADHQLVFVSKLFKRLVAQQLLKYLTENGLLPDRQSAYRAHHSTKTAVLQVVADILLALDSGNLAVLVLLDLSAAFDTIDHSTLLQRLRVSYVVRGLDRPTLHPPPQLYYVFLTIAIYMYIYFKDVNIENIGTHIAYHADLCTA